MSSLDTSQLSTLLLILMIALVVAAIAIVRFVGQATRRVIWLGGVCLLLIGSYAFRSELGTCSATCDCQILARDISVPTCVAGLTQTNNGNTTTTSNPLNNNQTDTVNGSGGADQSVVIDGANEGVRAGP